MSRAHAESVHRQSLWKIFRLPLLLGLSNAVGLAAALMGDGAWDVMSWLALGVPLALIGGYLRPTRAAAGETLRHRR